MRALLERRERVSVAKPVAGVQVRLAKISSPKYLVRLTWIVANTQSHFVLHCVIQRLHWTQII